MLGCVLSRATDAADKETTTMTTMTHTDQMIAIAEHKIHARQVVEVTS